MRFPTSKGFIYLPLLAISFLVSGSLARPTSQVNETETDGFEEVNDVSGWTEVSGMWPLNETQFYIATTKGYHSIDVNLPESRPSEDIELKFEYYYNAARVNPLGQVLACNTTFDMIPKDEPDLRGKWHTHEVSVRPDQCLDSNAIRYNFILHDAGDILAWRLLSVGPINDETITEAPTSDPIASTLAPTSTYPSIFITSKPVTSSTESSEMPETTTTVSLMDRTTNPSFGDSVSDDNQGIHGSNSEEASRKSGDTSDKEKDKIDPIYDSLVSNQNPNPDSSRPEGANSDHQTAPKSDASDSSNQSEPTTEAPRFSDDYPMGPQSMARFKRSLDEKTEAPEVIRGESEAKDGSAEALAKSTESQDASNKLPNTKPRTRMVCTPSLCDKTKFSFNNFKALVKGLPKIESDRLANGDKFFISLDDKPLEFKLRSKDDLSKVDVCLEWRLFMDADTELELRVQDIAGPDRLLETIRRDSRDSRSGQWEEFRRCISDYMPRLRPKDDRHSSVIRVKSFGGLRSGALKKICIMTNSQKPLSLNEPFPSRSFFPDAVASKSLKDFEETWIMDRDGLEKPAYLHMNNPKRVLAITRIDPHQESFDLTSRWIQIPDPSSVGNSVHFDYVLEGPDWLKSIVFESQSASKWHEGDDLSVQVPWRAETIYVAADGSLQAPRKADTIHVAADGSSNTRANLAPYEIDTKSPTTTQEKGETSSSSNGTKASITNRLARNRELIRSESARTKSKLASKANIVHLPIKLTNVGSDEFRIRIRHVLKEEARDHPMSHRLMIHTLALGDACARNDYCYFEGACKPIGTAQAECTCREGFAGDRCQEVYPCDVLYGTKTGHQICEQLNLKCNHTMSILSRTGPQCIAAESVGDGTLTPAIPQASISDEMLQLREQSDKQSRLIIVMSVFMLALLLFAIVIVSGMVSRLVRSRRRLERAQIEVHELTKRAEPSTSAAAFGAGYGRNTGRLKPPATIAYNNQSFDAS